MTNQIDASDRDLELFFVDVRVVSYLSYKNYLYTDTFIVEGKPYFDDEQNDNLVNPRVIVEVLSDSTESFDRGDKFKSYRQIPTLQEYILVNQKQACVEQFYRDETGKWIFGDIISEGVFKLKSLPFFLAFILLVELTGSYLARIKFANNTWLYNFSIPLEYSFYLFQFAEKLCCSF